MISVLAIDDEPLALMQLKKMIEQTPYFNLVGACQSAFEAIKMMQEHSVDALFADINMPDLSGMDFVKSLTNPPLVVFTTAYSQYAVDGYKVGAIDYLLKPFGTAEFQKAAAKVKEQYELRNASKTCDTIEADLSLTGSEGRLEGDILFIKVDYRLVRISISDIRYIESQSEYLKLHMANGQSHMILMSIKRLAELLPKDRFVRIHRSYVVNMAYVIEISRMRIKMDEKTFLPIGDLFKDEAQSYINARLMGK